MSQSITQSLKFLVIPIVCWVVVGLLSGGQYGLYIPDPPSNPNNSDAVAWLQYFASILGYVFTVTLSIISTVTNIITFSFIPSPWNYLLSFPFIIIFLLGLVPLFYALAKLIADYIPL